MNFSDAEKTGVLSEIEVERLFLSWGWNVGQDRVDAGYDFCITPDRNKFHGARFLVQVKGTAKKKSGTIVAQVSKSRLREYANDQLPVFIVRVTSAGKMYWVHAQQWAYMNRAKLAGGGYGGVRFDPACELGERHSFEAYLMRVLAEDCLPNGTRELMQESRMLSLIDPNFGVNVKMESGRKIHELLCNSGAKGGLKFEPHKTEENLQNLNEALDYGLPRSVNVDKFQAHGSPLFDHVGLSAPNSGVVSFRQASAQQGVVRVYPGTEFSITSAELSFDVDIYSGRRGVAFTNESRQSALDVGVFYKNRQVGDDSITFKLAVRSATIEQEVIGEVDALRPIVAWADQVLAAKAMHFELRFPSGRASIPVRDEQFSVFDGFVKWVRVLGRLHAVAKCLKSNWRVLNEKYPSDDEVRDIEMAYSLLKGERIEVKIGPIFLGSVLEIKPMSDARFSCATVLKIEVCNQFLGEIPIDLELEGYDLGRNAVEGSAGMCLKKGKAGRAWISHSKQPFYEKI